jgi:hypothetical protein
MPATEGVHTIHDDGDDDGAFDTNVLAAGWMRAGLDKGKGKEVWPLAQDGDAFLQEMHKLRQSLAQLQDRSDESDSRPGTTTSSTSRTTSSSLNQQGDMSSGAKDRWTVSTSTSQDSNKRGMSASNSTSTGNSMSSSNSMSTSRLLSSLSSYSSFSSSPLTTPGEADFTPPTPLRQSVLYAAGPSLQLITASTSASTSASASSSLPVAMSRKASTVFDVNRFDVQFKAVEISEVNVSRSNVVDALVKEYPELCEAPARMFASDGRPLPPTKKQEVSDKERQARKEALVVSYRGRMPHSLLQISVLLQSRVIIWRRVGDLTAIQQRPVAQVLDSSKLDPWAIHVVHSEVDIHEMADSNVKKTFEISKSRRIGKCDRCTGSKMEDCRSCHGSKPDECWWCSGSGKSSGQKCKTCSGKGVLECKPCQGTKKTACGLCKGEGMGLYAAFLQLSMTRVDFDVVPLSTLLNSEEEASNANLVRDACIGKARDVISAFITKDAVQEATKNKKAPRQHRVHQASALLNHSTSHLIEFSVAQEAKLVDSKTLGLSLRPSSLFKHKVSFLPFYGILPSDPGLRPVQLSQDEFSSYLATTTLSQG